MTMVSEACQVMVPLTPPTSGTSSAKAAQAVTAKPDVFLSVRLGREEYCIDILLVQAIRSY